MHQQIYGTAQFKLDNEMHVKLESLNKFVGPLVSRVSLREWEGALALLDKLLAPLNYHAMYLRTQTYTRSSS